LAEITTKRVVMYHRGFRGGRRRSSAPKPVTRTYKKVLNFADASFSAGFQQEQFALGVDGVAITQGSATDGNVPTGSKIKFVEFQFAVHNSVETPCFINCTLQYRLSGQTVQDPDLIGGNAQRNQVLHQDLFSVGALQNSTHKFKFKIPPKFQRLREGMAWSLTWSNSATVNRECQIIYIVHL